MPKSIYPTSQHNSVLIPTILCGGAGSRLWPLSRELHPKPFIRLEDGLSFLQKAFMLGASFPQVKEIFTVTNRDLFFKVVDDISEVNHSRHSTSYILEPYGRNTAPAVAFSALHASQTYGSEAILLILAADHLINHKERFLEAVNQAIIRAKKGKIVTFGIEPSGPETGYGYIEMTPDKAIRFIEKPTLELAKSYIKSGNYYWNSGIFCFTAKTILEEMDQHCPDILQAVTTCFQKSRKLKGQKIRQIELESKSFDTIQDISIDYAVMEKSENIDVIPCDIGWNDIGSWTSLGELITPDALGNRLQGEVLLQNSKNCIIQSNHHIVAATGINDLIVVDTPDAVMIAHKDSVQDVKKLYAELKARGHDVHRLHRKVYRPWGSYTILEEGPGFKIKAIEVKSGASLSLQKHQHRSEHWVVISGTAEVTNCDTMITLQPNESTFIPAGFTHRLHNPEIFPLTLIEVQTGDYLGEDDIIRYSDDYGRHL